MSEQRRISFVRALVRAFPVLRPTLDEHIEDNFGDILPYVFLGDVTRYVLSLVPDKEGDSSKIPTQLKEILQYLEKTYTSIDEDVETLIAVAFLENLQKVDRKTLRMLRELLGPNLRKQLNVILGPP